VDGSRDDEQLLAAYRAGDVAAFEALLARYEKPIWSYLRRFVRHDEAAEDLLQEVFLRVVRDAQDAAAPGWKGQAKFSTWLYTIARNLCVDRSRREGIRRAASLDAASDDGDAPVSLHDRIPGTVRAADAVLADRQAAQRIDRAIAALPDDQREVFLMREVMELPFAEIATVVGASEPTVKSRMRYALEKLRSALADLAGEDGADTPESKGAG